MINRYTEQELVLLKNSYFIPLAEKDENLLVFRQVFVFFRLGLLVLSESFNEDHQNAVCKKGWLFQMVLVNETSLYDINLFGENIILHCCLKKIFTFAVLRSMIISSFKFLNRLDQMVRGNQFLGYCQ